MSAPPPSYCSEDLECSCSRDAEVVVHDETCIFYDGSSDKKDSNGADASVEQCECCGCDVTKCPNQAIWRTVDEAPKKEEVEMPTVLEATHPLMSRFQDTLRSFLEKENAIAEEEILNLKEELRLSKEQYDKDLEAIYKSDHDTNAQRVLIEEYEEMLTKNTAERVKAEERAKEANERYKRAKEKLDQNIIAEREANEELEALTALCRQLEEWRSETESQLAVSQRVSDKMRIEKKELADEKRQLDMFIFGLSNEVWKLESKLELFKKQLEIKNVEMEKVNDKVTAYAAELEDLELDKRRLMSLWNSVLVNIKQRDKVYDSVRDDYKTLQENYRTLLNNFEITKKLVMEEMQKGKEIAMKNEKTMYDIGHVEKTLKVEDTKRIALETQIQELQEAIRMTERDEQLIKTENQTMANILKSTEKEIDRKNDIKLQLENEILTNLQECLLNDKAVEAMANGIKKMREMSRKQEIVLMTMENNHAKLMLEIEVYRNRQTRNKEALEVSLAQVKEREKEVDQLEEKYKQKMIDFAKKQRELDIITKKYNALKEIFDLKTPQERRISELEQQIRGLRERAETLQHEWLRLQGHVVRLAQQHHEVVTNLNIINKQISICEQKLMRTQAEKEHIIEEKQRVDRTLRSLRGRLEVLERERKSAAESHQSAQLDQQAVAYNYSANLKEAESEIIKLEEEIEEFEKEKMNLTQELDRVQREALIWQRKSVMAVDLKKSLTDAKSSAGEIGQMKSEIHRMEVRRDQLRKTSEKLAEDLSLYVTRRETAIEKSRAAAAVEKVYGSSAQTPQAAYKHKLRLAKADVARVTKDLAEAKARMEHLEREQERLEREIADTGALNAQLEEHVASLMKETRETDKQKQWLLERVVRSQRLGNELSTAVRRQVIRVKKPKAAVLSEYEHATAFNDQFREIVQTLASEYPYLNDEMEAISNTLNIHGPDDLPKLVEDCSCSWTSSEAVNENIPEKLE
ncbi:myosin-16-like [Aricia agestis]|uniref:myosin-16-like n=1 Tax=Aricia agestis TaxID=91739 RepID=UPI001C20A59A|nr:myosin-16-like [Aricia agestis]